MVRLNINLDGLMKTNYSFASYDNKGVIIYENGSVLTKLPAIYYSEKSPYNTPYVALGKRIKGVVCGEQIQIEAVLKKTTLGKKRGRSIFGGRRVVGRTAVLDRTSNRRILINNVSICELTENKYSWTISKQDRIRAYGFYFKKYELFAQYKIERRYPEESKCLKEIQIFYGKTLVAVSRKNDEGIFNLYIRDRNNLIKYLLFSVAIFDSEDVEYHHICGYHPI